MPFDIGIGLVLGIVLGSNLGVSPLEAALLGALFTLLPDLDFLIHRIRRRPKVDDYQHRDLLHRPIPYLIAAGSICAVVAPSALPFVLSASLVHFLHDSVGIGWGVPWLWPLSRDHFGFVYHLANPTRRDGSQFQPYFRWSQSQLSQLVRAEGDPDWIRHIYMGLHPYALIEYTVLALGLAFTLVMI